MGVLHAIIAAHRANIDLDFDRAAAIDLAGRDVLDAVRTSVYPKVIDCPDPQRSGKTTLSAIAKNGVELKTRARVTVRTNLEQLIGGATEETIIAPRGREHHLVDRFVGDALGGSGASGPHLAPCWIAVSTRTPRSRLCRSTSPISMWARTSGLVCRPIRPTPTREWPARAEQRRAEAVAYEQEMKAKVAENRARLVLAEAEVPRAMADAFRQGNLQSSGS